MTLVQPVRLSLEDITDPPRERFVIGTMIPFAKSSVLYGPTTVGKSALAAQVVFAFAAGADSLWGLPIYCDEETDERGGPALVYTAEDSLDDWKRKGATILAAGGIDVQRALERLWVADQSEGVARLSEALMVRGPVDPATPERTVTRRVARPTDEQENLIAMAQEIGARLILVETASRLVDDEDNANFAALQSATGRIARATGAGVLLSHHATKAATKENDSAIESARGGGALIANARNALALFPAEEEEAKPYRDRFPAEDILTLRQTKSTSSTRRARPLVLVRFDATPTGAPEGVYGAVLRLPDDVALTPEQEQTNAVRVEEQRQRQLARLRRLYEVVEKALPARPAISPSWLRDHCHTEIGAPKNGPAGVEALVRAALEAGILRVNTRSSRGVTLTLGVDPRKPISSARANPGESSEEAA